MGYRVLANLVVVVHFAFLGYVIAGGFIALRWRRTIWAHLAASAWAVAILTVPGLVCPLTMAQNWALHRAGEAEIGGGFIDTYVKNVIYPARYTAITQLAVGLAIIASWWLFLRQGRRIRDRLSHREGDLRRA